MDVKKKLFLIVIFLLSFFIIKNWQNISNYHIKSNIIHINNNIHEKLSDKLNRNNIIIKTDKLILYIDLNGGNITKMELINYKNKLYSKKHLTLLNNNKQYIYQANSNIIKTNKFNLIDHIFDKPKFFTPMSIYQLKNNTTILKVPLLFVSKNILYVKTFIIKKGSFVINVNHQIFNYTKQPICIKINNELNQKTNNILPFLNRKHINFATKTFRGIAYSTSHIKYKKYPFRKILQNNNIKIYTNKGWIAIIQQYFATAWIVPHNNYYIYTQKVSNNIIRIGFYSINHMIVPGGNAYFTTKLWAGPKITNYMATVAPFLDYTIDYGILWFLAQPLFQLLNYIYNLIGNWGISIIIITCIVRIVTYPLSKMQYITMIKMRMLQPKIKSLKIKFNNDKNRLSKEIINLYQKEKLNPLSGCLPFIIQMPIFLSLYYILINSVELRHAPFFLWIKDLSAEDPYYIFPVIMGITIFFMQKISVNNYEKQDVIQKLFIYIIPCIFSLFFLWFPSGLVLYYIISNIITIIQQGFIYDKIYTNIKHIH
ncbi:membrane protein insertase YidC [Enterobacteriaceae endosymbiont of Neohaemonia nigricornis]|uniref:membrane protein insertase YidC n=1 Tax=Enterobacteriaceae endosymbiont of Neohaemonia nigricornis TaxID=2675792 RepID=UPI001ABFC177|nr:membrane protein insertase YidC [Enterobacteriaceae endosymbiont of Neohaemonia nigricornis]